MRISWYLFGSVIQGRRRSAVEGHYRPQAVAVDEREVRAQQVRRETRPCKRMAKALPGQRREGPRWAGRRPGDSTKHAELLHMLALTSLAR